ncbi:uncharacterized protein YeaO (DUF488 family) [Halomonas fontilapidosi]|uniref:Uncharacterized protein YeaO (DUF488 family) n=1 Tax=Halomonas fontilapidosi TaxID=616675 RepID=A0A7W5GY57_9GAMM|nr:hypothetical protein [Halomonas fontilapidosi]MBB3182942.1 uncharacterized protein YeaO (DUF488 family) [Halomonas fontilapidosi]
MAYDIVLNRIYQPIAAEDGNGVGARVRRTHRESVSARLSRRLPRGQRRSTRLAHQLGEISAEVFFTRYRGELREAPENLIPLMRHARQGRLTLLSAARDLEG